MPHGATASVAGDEVAAQQKALALEQAKNEVLHEQVLKAEDSLAIAVYDFAFTSLPTPNSPLPTHYFPLRGPPVLRILNKLSETDY